MRPIVVGSGPRIDRKLPVDCRAGPGTRRRGHPRYLSLVARLRYILNHLKLFDVVKDVSSPYGTAVVSPMWRWHIRSTLPSSYKVTVFLLLSVLFAPSRLFSIARVFSCTIPGLFLLLYGSFSAIACFLFSVAPLYSLYLSCTFTAACTTSRTSNPKSHPKVYTLFSIESNTPYVCVYLHSV